MKKQKKQVLIILNGTKYVHQQAMSEVFGVHRYSVTHVAVRKGIPIKRIGVSNLFEVVGELAEKLEKMPTVIQNVDKQVEGYTENPVNECEILKLGASEKEHIFTETIAGKEFRLLPYSELSKLKGTNNFYRFFSRFAGVTIFRNKFVCVNLAKDNIVSAIKLVG